MIVVLGTGANQVTFEQLLKFDEEKSRRVPRKIDLGTTGTVETAAYLVRPRRFNLKARLSTAERISLYALQAEHVWQPLNDDAALIDYVWIETVEPRWRPTEDITRPWLTFMGLIASNV